MDYRNLYKPKQVEEKPINLDWIKSIAKKFNEFFGEMNLEFINCLECNKSEVDAINNPAGDDYKPIEIRNQKVCYHDIEDGFQFSRVISDNKLNFKCINVDLIKCWANKFSVCPCREKESSEVRCDNCNLVKSQIVNFDGKNYCSVMCIKKSLNK